MKLWIAFILSFALMFAGFANAVDAAMLCDASMDQHDTPSLEAGTQIACADCSQADQKADHDHGSDHAQPGKCVSSCCGSLCFLPTQVQFDTMSRRGTYGTMPQVFFVETIGLVQERPPKFLG